MATTLSYGVILPVSGDIGATVWDALESDITQLNDHNHNGTNSARLTAASATATVQNHLIADGAWSSLGSGTYSKTITIPTTLSAVSGTFDDYNLQVRIYSTKEVIYPRIVKASSTTFTIYSNDSTLEVTFLYT